MKRRAAARLAVLAALICTSFPLAPAPVDAAADCRRAVTWSGYHVVFVTAGQPCRSVVVWKCRRQPRQRHRIVADEPLDIRQAWCQYPVKWAKIRPAR